MLSSPRLYPMYRKFYKSSFEIFFIFCLIFKLFIFQISICRKQLQNKSTKIYISNKNLYDM
jgi:hypothetical protein